MRQPPRPDGISRADSSNLAGQHASVICKQLWDFRSEARTNASLATKVIDQEIADLSVYYAHLPRRPAFHPVEQLPKPRIVIYGAAVRGIAPCGSCHGSLDNKTGSPWLGGPAGGIHESAAESFRTRTAQQRRQPTDARAMTPQELGETAAYFAFRAPDVVKAVD